MIGDRGSLHRSQRTSRAGTRTYSRRLSWPTTDRIEAPWSSAHTLEPLVASLIGGNTACGIRLEDSRDITPTGMECELIAMRHPTQLKTIEYRGALITDVVAPDPAKVPYVRSPLSWMFPKGAVPVPAAAADPSD